MNLSEVNDKNLFSIIIPNYKRVAELKRALDSIRSQFDYSELVDQIIIVDDKSDNIKDIENLVLSYNDPKITLIKNDFKSNAAATRNQGAKIARTPWVCFLDSDDAFNTNKLLLLREYIQSGADVYYNKAQVYFNDEIEDVVPHRALKKNEHISDYLFVSGQYMQTSTLTVRRSFFDNNGFNENYIRHQDYDLCLTFNDHHMKIELADFIGTFIYWNSTERPNNKGESYDYSLNWLQENKSRITPLAFKYFYFNFIVLKAARNGAKIYSFQHFLKMKNKHVGIKKMLTYMFVLAIPVNLQHWAYIKYKKVKIYAAKKRTNKYIKK